MTDRIATPITGPQPRLPFRRAALALVVLVAIAVLLALITSRPAVSVHTGSATSVEKAISIEADGWTYSVPLDGVRWIDADGTWHERGRPDCLPETGATGPITFGAVEVTIEGARWRPVVWVSCR